MWAHQTNHFIGLFKEFCPNLDKPDEIADYVEIRLARNVYRLWREQEDVDKSLRIKESGYSAGKLADDSLQLMGCNSSEEFIAKAQKLSTFTIAPQYHPYIFDASDPEYKSFRKFIDDAIRDNRNARF